MGGGLREGSREVEEEEAKEEGEKLLCSDREAVIWCDEGWQGWKW